MKNRLISFILILIMAVSILAGCSEKTPEQDPIPPQDNVPEQNTPQNNDVAPKEYVYHASVSPLSDVLADGYSVDAITSFCVSGNTVFLSARSFDPDASTEPYYDPVTDEMFEGEDAYKTLFFAIDPETSVVTQLRYEPTSLKEGRDGTYLLSDVCPGENGTVWIVEAVKSYYYDLPDDFDPEADSMWNYYVADAPLITLMHFDASGELLSSCSLSHPSDAGELYTLMADLSGNVYAASLDSVFVYDASGGLKAELELSGGSIQHFGAKGIGHVAYVGSNQEIRMIDPNAGTFSNAISIGSSAWTLGQGSTQYDCTYVQNGVIWGLSTDTSESAPILDWLSCDLNASDILKYSVLDDGSILALAKEGNRYSLVQAELVDASTIPARQELVLATAYLRNDLRTAIVNFNRSQDSLRIRVKDYSQNNMEVDGLLGSDALMRDISNGNVPDLLYTNDLPMYYLVNQGILTDLNPMIASDEELSGDALMSHLFETAEIDGKLYEISSRFTISTAATSAETAIGSQWTYDAAGDALDSMSEGATVLGSSAALKQMISVYLYSEADEFVDWTSMSCNYNSEEFLDALRFFNSLNLQINQVTGKKESEYRKIYSNKQLLSLHSIDDLLDITYANALHRSNISFVGYPTNDGAKSYFQFENPIAITSACTDMAAAWEFVRIFLTEDYQNAEQGTGLPTNKASFDAYAEKMMTPEYSIDSEGNQIEVSRGSVKLDDIISIDLYAVSEQEFNLFNDLYTQCDHMGRSDQKLINLINTEITTMLDGRSSEETSAAIQTAVAAYLNQLK